MYKYLLLVFLSLCSLYVESNLTVSSSSLSQGSEYLPSTILSTSSSRFAFTCSGTNVAWFSFSCNLNLFRKAYHKLNFITSNPILHISNFEDTCAYYQCIIFYKNTIIYEKTFRIVNIESKKIRSSLIYSNNSLFSIAFSFSANLIQSSEYKLLWFLWKNEKISLLKSNKYIYLSDNKVVVKTIFNEDNYGFIPCLVNIISEKIYKCGNSSFILKSKLGHAQKIVYANVNDYIILYCNDYRGLNIKWYKDSKPLRFDHRIISNYFFIVISHFITSDSGHYQCISEKPFQMPYNLSVFVVPFNDNNFQLPINTIINKREKSTFALPCKNPYQDEIPKFALWSYNIFNSLSYASAFQNPSINFDLYIYDASYHDSGLYQCLVEVSGQFTVLSFRIHIENENPLETNTIHILKKRSTDEAGEITNLIFKAFSNNINLSWSPPTVVVKKYIIKWGKMYPGPHKQTIDGKENKFTIPSLRPETTYFINIVAETVNGLTKPILRPIVTKEENKEIILAIPVNLKLLEVGDNWSKISWETRTNDEINEIISEKVYQVEYCPIRSQRGQKIYKNTTDTTLKIIDVKPATTYEFAVKTCLVNSSKCSDWSMVQEFTTLGTKPGDPPQHLTLSTIQLTPGPSENSKSNHAFAVQVSWQPPKDPNGEIKNYLILVTAEKRLDISNWGERTVSGKTLNTVIDRLDLNRYYYFRIRCSNEYGKSPLSPIRIFKTPNENGKNVGPVYLSKDYYDPMEIKEDLKLSRSIERGTDDFPDIINGEKKVSKNDRLGLSGYKWWIIIGIVVGAALIFILIILFFVAIKCRNENANIDFHSKTSKKQQKCNIKYGMDKNEKVKFVNKGPILTTPDLFRHTKDQNCHSNYLELEERNESPNSFSSNKAFPGLNHNQSFPSQNNYRNIPGHYTPPGLIHQQNIVMTTSQLTNSSNERHFYQVPFLHHVGHNSFNVFANSAPRVNAAASDFNSINVPSPISDFSDFTSSQATILYDTSTAKSSGGKSSLSGSGSYNNGLGNKSSLTNEPILEAYSSEKNNEILFNESGNQGNSVSKAFSSEELCQEMANLEGLMKDLNNITQKEFEC